MSTRRTPIALAMAVAAVLFPAGAAQAAGKTTGKTVFAGPFEKVKGVPEYADVNDFFPRTIKVNAKQVLTFRILGFHVVTFLPKGQPPPGFIVPDAAHPVSGQKDAAGNPFAFNGNPSASLNLKVIAPVGPRSIGKADYSSSGLARGRGAPPPPFKVSFKTPGTYRYVCPTHPGMTGKVVVVAKGKRVPAPKQDLAAARKQLAAVAKLVKKLDAPATAGPDTIQAGSDEAGVSLFKFVPSNLTVKAGTPVTLQMPASSRVGHTFSFGPEAYLKQQVQNQIQPPAGPSSGPTFNPVIAYPSDAPGQAWTYDGSNHGNGFFNTGLMDSIAATPQPQKVSVTFTKAGTFPFICLVHPDMRGTVTVTQ